MKHKPISSIEIKVRVIPRSSQNRAEWAGEDCVKVWVHSAPVKGEANDAVEDCLAKSFQVPVRQVALVRGQTSRSKTFRIEGLTWEEAHERLG